MTIKYCPINEMHIIKETEDDVENFSYASFHDWKIGYSKVSMALPLNHF